MTRSLKADGHHWSVELSRERPHDGVRAVIFRCTSNSSYGWRVVEVPEADVPDTDRLDDLGDDEVHALFERAQPFDYSHDPHARPDSIGEGTSR